jgi:2'-5' RNA ligase
MPHRLFIAVDLPQAVRRRLARLVDDAPSGVRPVRPDQIHLTLHFLGDADDATLAAVGTALARITRPAFTLDLAGTGVFPPRGRPAVLWVGVAPSDALAALHGDVARALVACGLTPDTRPWVPHVTLARLTPRVPRDWVEASCARKSNLHDRGIPVTEVRLYESVRTPEGAQHVPVASVALAGSRD